MDGRNAPYVGATQAVDLNKLLDKNGAALSGAVFVVTIYPPSGAAPTVTVESTANDYHGYWVPAVAGLHGVDAEATAPGVVYRGKMSVHIHGWP